MSCLIFEVHIISSTKKGVYDAFALADPGSTGGWDPLAQWTAAIKFIKFIKGQGGGQGW